MKTAVWRTGHPICDTVAQSLARGFNADIHHASNLNDDTIRDYDCHIAYGILRGTADVFRDAERLGKPWFNVDKGYFGSGHYSGTYRISLRGTQFRWSYKLPCSERCPTLKPWRSGSKILICPPTDDVCEFFNIDHSAWLGNALRKAGKDYEIRYKNTNKLLDLSEYGSVITFNSSVGWLALQDGIPCISDPLHSAVGSYYHTKCIEKLAPEFQSVPREPLFAAMLASQLTLEQIEQGEGWLLLKSLLDGMQERQLPQMSLPTQFAEELKPTLI